MNKLTSEERLIVDEVRKDIKALQLKQNELYDNLTSRLGNIDELQEGWLFDYVHNCEDTSDSEYTKQVIDYLFEQ